MSKSLNFIDLFAGCGGMSEGFYRMGYNALAHVEIDPTCCKTLKKRMDYYEYPNSENSILNVDITREDILDCIDKVIKNQSVDVIIGGPPCQAYSTLGRAKDENGMKNDPRNYLFESYVKVLNHYLPKYFVFENVTGILTATVGKNKIIDLVFKELSKEYKVIFDPQINTLNSVHYGVPQLRKRVIIIGVRKDLDVNPQDIYSSIIKTHYSPDDTEAEKLNKKKYITVKDALEKLPFLYPGEGERFVLFDYNLDNEFLRRIGTKKLPVLMDHVARNHNEIDRKRYREMAKNKWTFKELLENREDLRHEKARVFNNSYTVQWWDLPSKTIIAHLYKDGNQFIHPDYNQERTFTVREAARIQSFPDDFVFMGPRTEQYKQIGNAVPPLLAEAIAKAMKRFL